MKAFNDSLPVLVLTCLTMTGCGNSAEKTSDATPATKEESAVTSEKYVSPLPADAPTYSVATFEFEPFKSQDKYGNDVGYDVDILHAISEEEGIKFDIKQIPYSDLFEFIKKGEYDLAVSGLVMNPERQASMEASLPYAHNSVGYMVKEESTYNTAEELETSKIAIMRDTPPHKILAKKGIPEENFVLVDTTFLSFQSLATDKAEAVAGSEASLWYTARQFDMPVKFIPFTKKLSIVAYSKKGNTDVINQFNNGMDTIKANGKYQEINKKWFVEHANSMMVK